MDYLVQFQLNFFVLLVLIAIFVTIKLRTKINTFGNKLLKIVIILNIIAVIVEPLTWIFDGESFFGAFFLEYSTNFVLNLIGPIIAGFMISYVDYHLFGDIEKIKKRILYMHASIFTLGLLIINIFYPIYFSVSSSNTFQRGNFIWIQYTVLILMYVYTLGYLFINREKTDRRSFLIFTFFFLLPIIGMIMQIIQIRLYFSWSFIVLSILVIYIFLESTSGEEDYLTKLYSRLSFEKCIKILIDKKCDFQILLIDLDNFKMVNDKYGHLKGDNILVNFSTILKQVFTKQEYICRLGGDEFIVIANASLNMDEHIEKIQELIKQAEDEVMQNLRFSYGYNKHEEDMTMDQLYTLADKKMYADKKNNLNS